MKVDDAHVGFLDGIPRERRDELVQEFVDVSEFVENVRKIRLGQEEAEETPREETAVIKETEENPQDEAHHG